MKLTKNMIVFTVINTISSIVYFTLLGKGIGYTKTSSSPETYVTTGLIGAPFISGLIWWISASVLAKLDKKRNTRLNVGLAYHALTTFILTVTFIYSYLMFEAFHWIDFLIYSIIAIALSLLVHWLAVRNNPKGIDSKKAFK
jgi:hypothetical protein